MEKNNVKYFLAANSCEGFVSYFKNCYSAEKGWKSFIIKGGPGTGKSSFMKFLVSKAEENGVIAELFPCSSDPDSLDAVIFPQKKIVVMDGTNPHTVDPDFPGVCETILNFSDFWRKNILEQNTKEILSATKRNKQLHMSASRYIRALGNLMEDNLRIANMATDKAKAASFANRLCKQYIPPKDSKGYEWERFLAGITPKGVVFYGNSVLKSCEKAVIIEDEFGGAADAVMRRIRLYAIDNGYEIITVKNAFLPSQLIDHIVIPKLSLCFLRESEYGHFDTDIRRIHARRFVNLSQLHKSRERLKFNQKAVRQLLFTSAALLSEAKAVHDEMEMYYISAMDFPKLTEFANEFVKGLF